MCMITNPGTTPKRRDKLPVIPRHADAMRECKKCHAAKPPRAHHCSLCNHCVFKMDHHCPWMNNCIGMYNTKHFMLFLLYVFLMCAMSMSTLVAWVAVGCDTPLRPPMLPVDLTLSREQAADIIRLDPPHFGPRLLRERKRRPLHNIRESNEILCDVPPAALVGGVTLMMESMIFGIFTIVMLVDQLNVACEGISGVESLSLGKRMPHHALIEESLRNRTTWTALKEVMGGRFSVKWFLPTPVDPEYCHGGLTELDLFVLNAGTDEFYVDLENREPSTKSRRRYGLGPVKADFEVELSNIVQADRRKKRKEDG